MKLTVQPHSLRISCRSNEGKEHVCTFNLPKDFSTRLQPQSLSGLAVSNESVSFRLQTEPHQDMSGSFSAQVLMLEEAIKNDVNDNRAPSITPGQPYRIECACCGYSPLITPEMTFRRVLPLPSSVCDTNDFFCHKHPNEDSNDMGTDPRGDDCFYSTALIRLNKSLFWHQQSEVLYCKRCFSWLGTHDKYSTSLWTCTTVVRPVSDNLACSIASDAVQDFVDVVKDAMRESMSIACRIVLEARSSPGESVYLLLWVLDRDLLTLSARIDVENASSAVLIERRIAKVLFIFETSSSQLLSTWMNDVRVQLVKVALPILYRGTNMLVKTSRLLSSTNRIGQNGFFIGYLCPDLIK